jgi:FixJ family two-component response regulator
LRLPGTTGAAMTPSKKSAPETIYLVDDDSAVLRSIGRLLASDGFSARSFDKPKDFLAYVQTNAVPLVVLDVWMPDMNGLEIQAVLRNDSPETRIIFISGRDDPSVRQAALDAGAFGFLSKPFDDEALLQLVRKAAGA